MRFVAAAIALLIFACAANAEPTLAEAEGFHAGLKLWSNEHCSIAGDFSAEKKADMLIAMAEDPARFIAARDAIMAMLDQRSKSEGIQKQCNSNERRLRGVGLR